ncbi:trichothecene efflux pump [Trichodelitschia bisporula]|uniref:Trichothecene efflux pump n=1 Tax=Trichodelitschia bisporula TaxID=703511 RepID=A0A6G1HK30_9PEZI|nr:trichothecene efflux pump [Trichodelitschia bisporula]
MSDKGSDQKHPLPEHHHEKQQLPEHHNEKQYVERVDHVSDGDVHVVKVTHADGVVDFVDAHAVGGSYEDMPKGYFTSYQFIGTMLAASFAAICSYLGWVLPANTLMLINADIGPDPNIGWVATCWTLGCSVGFLLVGRLSDIFGRKWMVLGTQVLSTVAMILGATAHSINQLIAATLLNGLASAGQLSHGIIIGELVPNKLRGPAITLVFLAPTPFAVFGPAIARAFILHTGQGWRWSFYLGIITSVASLALYQFCYHPPSYNQLHVHGKTKMQMFKELDFVGIFLFIAGTVLFLIGMSWGGTTYPWKSAHVVSMIVVGGVTLIAFGLYEQYVFKGQALMPPRLFKNIGYVAIVVIASIGAMIYYSLTVLAPTMIGAIWTTDVMEIGLQCSFVGGGILLGQILAGFGISYIPLVKWQTILASTLAFVFFTALASISESGHASFMALATLGCIAIGYVDNISFPGVTLVLGPEDIGLGTGVLGSIRALAGAVAQALYSSVLNNKLNTYMPQYVAPAATGAGLPESSLPALFAGITAGNFSGVAGATDKVLAVVAAQVKHAYIDSFKMVFYATIPFSVILVISSYWVPNMEEFLHGNVARRLQQMGDKDGEAKEGVSISAVEKETNMV